MLLGINQLHIEESWNGIVRIMSSSDAVIELPVYTVYTLNFTSNFVRYAQSLSHIKGNLSQ